jgi:hypothetical protein
MNRTDILAALDRDRRGAGEVAGAIVRERDGDGYRIAYSHCDEDELDATIAAEQDRARRGGYPLEWKVYSHDTPAHLGDRLGAAGFEPADLEAVLVLPLTADSISAFAGPRGEVPRDEVPYEIRRVHDAAGLADVADIAREIGRRNVVGERDGLARSLRDSPDAMSVHVAYVDGEPVSSGRIHFPAGSELAELAGGRTKTGFRNRGLFTAVVAARLLEAVERGRRHVLVDALPTSEPILRRRGFQLLAYTQPFEYEP